MVAVLETKPEATAGDQAAPSGLRAPVVATCPQVPSAITRTTSDTDAMRVQSLKRAEIAIGKLRPNEQRGDRENRARP